METGEEKKMVHNIETRQEQDGNWVAEVLSIPGLQVYGYSQEETLAEAGKLAAMLMGMDTGRNTLILGFYPGTIPDWAKAAGQPLANLHSSHAHLGPERSYSYPQT
jgi:hypothetical protein